MGQLIKGFDWNKSLLGPISGWPQTLKTTISLILRSRFPMFLYWGPQFVCFYNDAFRPSLREADRQPDLLGLPAAICLSDVWKSLHPLIEEVFTEGISVVKEDQQVPVSRNGTVEEAYWTFSYIPVID